MILSIMLQIVYVTASWEEFEKFGKFMSIKGEIGSVVGPDYEGPKTHC